MRCVGAVRKRHVSSMPIGVLPSSIHQEIKNQREKKYSANTTAIEGPSGHSPNTVQLVTTLLRFIARVMG